MAGCGVLLREMAQFVDMSRKPDTGEVSDIPGNRVRRERNLQRLQIGGTGIVMMVLLVALASVVSNRAAQTDATAVPEAAPTTEPTQAMPQNDPLAEAGVVPELPAEPTTAVTGTPSPAAPEQDFDAPQLQRP